MDWFVLCIGCISEGLVGDVFLIVMVLVGMNMVVVVLIFVVVVKGVVDKVCDDGKVGEELILEYKLEGIKGGVVVWILNLLDVDDFLIKGGV